MSPALLKPWLAGLLALALLDGLWLGVVARGFYQQEMGALMRASIDWRPAALFYLAYPLAVIWLAQALQAGHWSAALWRGAGLGLVVYGVYDLTNLSTLAGWSTRLALVDTAWGALVTGAVALAAHAARPAP